MMSLLSGGSRATARWAVSHQDGPHRRNSVQAAVDEVGVDRLDGVGQAVEPERRAPPFVALFANWLQNGKVPSASWAGSATRHLSSCLLRADGLYAPPA